MINLSSTSAIVPLAGYSVYGSTKKFVEYFSQAIAYEAREYAHIAVFLPGGIDTAMTHVQGFKANSS
jgi:short-subunit dehydrogenase